MEQDTKQQASNGDRGLQRLFTNLLKIFGVLLVAFIIIYTFGQRTSSVKVTPVADVNVTSAEAAVRANPNDITVRLELADAYLRAGRQDDALDQLNEILKADPKNLSAMMGAASIMMDQGDTEKAKEHLLKYVSIAAAGEFASRDSQLERAYYMLGDIAENAGDNVSAVGLYKKAVEIGSTDADAWFRLGRTMNATKDFTGAADAFRRALAFVPEGWCEPYAGLADAYAGSKNADGQAFAGAMVNVCEGGGLADAAPLKELVKGDFKIEALLGLGLAAEHDKDLQTALGYYKQVTAVESSNVAAVNAIARIKASTTTPAA